MAERQTPRWTDADLAFAWQLGYEARGAGEDVLAALADARHATVTPAKLSKEERVQQRIALFERCAAEFHAKHGTRPWAGANRESLPAWE